MTPFARRIEALYRAATGAEGRHGAQTWFAAQADVDSRTVRHWVAGTRTPRGPAVRLLEALEERAGLLNATPTTRNDR